MPNPSSQTNGDADTKTPPQGSSSLSLFLTGDVMTGRWIDQILPHSVEHRLFEPYIKNAGHYAKLAEARSGPFPEEVSFDYVWGDGLADLEKAAPGVRIINLETALTTSEEAWPQKTIHYRMHPANAPLLDAAGIDVCVLANNHILDWGYDGLEETLQVLRKYGHSSHHPKSIEVYNDCLILYGCGDLINDYEGINGYEEYRWELSLLYFSELSSSGALASLRMSPMKIRHFRLQRAGRDDVKWLAAKLNRECRTYGTGIEQTGDGHLVLSWDR